MALENSSASKSGKRALWKHEAYRVGSLGDTQTIIQQTSESLAIISKLNKGSWVRN